MDQPIIRSFLFFNKLPKFESVFLHIYMIADKIN